MSNPIKYPCSAGMLIDSPPCVDSISEASFEILPDPLTRPRPVPEYRTAISRTAMTPSRAVRHAATVKRSDDAQPTATAPAGMTTTTSRIRVIHPDLSRSRMPAHQNSNAGPHGPSPAGGLYSWLKPVAGRSSSLNARAISTSPELRTTAGRPLELDLASLSLGESIADNVSVASSTSASRARRHHARRPVFAPPRRLAPQPRSPLPLFSYLDSTLPHARGLVPSITYTASAAEVGDLLGCLRGGVYGFDLEWPVWSGVVRARATGKDGEPADKVREWQNPGKTALVQICDERMVLLIHVSMMSGGSEYLAMGLTNG